MTMNEAKGKTTPAGVEYEIVKESDGQVAQSGQEVEAYMTKNEVKVHTTPAGVKYQIIKESDGQIAQSGHKVEVHYTGWLNDQGETGKKFDSSLDRGDPFVFNLGHGQVIKGWDEGVAGMRVGEKRTLFIPAALGYGSRGAGSAIPPHADLIFDVELISIKN